MSHRYQTFGITIESALPLPELLPAEDEPDATIRLGSVPEAVENPVQESQHYQSGPREVLFRVEGVGRYYVHDGKGIVVEPATGCGESEVRLFLLSNAVAALLHQRGVLPLHASALDVGGRCVAFAGHRGAGKSTVAAALLQRGHHVMSDDVCALALENGAVVAYPGYPQFKLTPDTARMLSVDWEQGRNLGPRAEKRGLPIHDCFRNEPRPFARLYLLEVANLDTPRITPIQGMEKVDLLLNHTYRLFMLHGSGRPAAHLEQCAAIARHVDMRRIQRPEKGDDLQDFMAILEDDMKDMHHE